MSSNSIDFLKLLGVKGQRASFFFFLMTTSVQVLFGIVFAMARVCNDEPYNHFCVTIEMLNI